jgi:dUTP pyrophosphatase
MLLEYSTMHANVTHPQRSNPSDAGLDIFFSPANGEDIRIFPGQSVVLETGLKFGVPHGYMLEVKNRSSVASKRSLLVGACVIDSGYAGEVKINLHNVGNEPQLLQPGDKIAQVVMVPVVHFRPCLTDEEQLYSSPITISDRGDGGFGSTGK